jgi:hypothetical protein
MAEWHDISDLWWMNPRTDSVFKQPSQALGYAQLIQRRREANADMALKAQALQLRAKEHELSYHINTATNLLKQEEMRREAADLPLLNQKLLNPKTAIQPELQSYKGIAAWNSIEAAQQKLADEKWWSTTIDKFMPKDRMMAKSMREASDGAMTQELSSFMEESQARSSMAETLRKGPAGVFAAALSMRKELGGISEAQETELLDAYLKKLSGLEEVQSRLADVDKILLRGEVDAVNRDILSTPEEKQAALNAIEEKYKKKLGESPSAAPAAPQPPAPPAEGSLLDIPPIKRMRFNPATLELIDIP